MQSKVHHAGQVQPWAWLPSSHHHITSSIPIRRECYRQGLGANTTREGSLTGALQLTEAHQAYEGETNSCETLR